MSQNTILWVYIILLLIGGMIGFLKAGSKISLITSSVAAALLVLTALPGVFTLAFRRNTADVIMAALLVVFRPFLLQPVGGFNWSSPDRPSSQGS